MGTEALPNTQQSHFVTFSCYHRYRLFTSEASRHVFELALDRVRRTFKLRVYGYVIMPDHVHLLLSEPERDTLARALKSLKQGVARQLLDDLRTSTNVLGGPLKPDCGLSGELKHVWQKRYYDFNIRNHQQFVEKLRYIHRNPVKAGLCERPEDWAWSSFLHYATGCEARVEIESDWTARKREREGGRISRRTAPLKPKAGLSGPPVGRKLSFRTMAIDWEDVAKRVGDLPGNTYSTMTGRRALEIIVGEENVRNAVDYWISQEPGCFTAEMVLSIMRPTGAMERCYEIYKSEPDSENAVSAVFLLASFAQDEALPWVREFLEDRNRDIRWNGLAVLRTILYGPLGDAAIDTATQLLGKAEQDSDPEIRERAKQLRREFRSEEPYDRIWQ